MSSGVYCEFKKHTKHYNKLQSIERCGVAALREKYYRATVYLPLGSQPWHQDGTALRLNL